MNDLTKTLTKRDCDKIIKSFEEMQRCAQLSIDALKQMDSAVEEGSKIMRDWRDSCGVSIAERERFVQCIRDYGALNNIGCNVCYGYDELTITFDDMKTGRAYEHYSLYSKRSEKCEVRIFWSEVTDLSETTRKVIEYMNRDLLKI